MTTIRKSCVLCLGQLSSLYTIPNMPVTCAPTTRSPETDFISDMEVGVCNDCECVQLVSLIDPTILYNESHNETAETPTWKDHHRAFADFVKNQQVKSILEIGGSSGSLYRNLPPNLEYTCMDLCKAADGIPSIQANCETYDFAGTESICMSHVFEHLYNPRQFVEHIAPSVKTVILSIPNMTHLLSIGSMSIVFNEHTYFIDLDSVQWLFARCGYRLRASEDFREHSIFMCFEKTSEEIACSLKPRPRIAEMMRSIYSDMISRCSRIAGVSDPYIVPAGHMGQMLYILLQPKSSRGFLDNDKSKQGKRVYGTPYIANPMTSIKNVDSPNVIVYAGVYTDEICAQIRELNMSASIYTV